MFPLNNFEKKWRVDLHPDARKYLRRIPLLDWRALDEGFSYMEENPYGGDVRKMKGEEHTYRRRVRAYRIFYRIGGGIYWKIFTDFIP